MKKKCTGKCKQVKPLDDFHKDKSNKDGKARYCKKCKGDAEKANRDKKREDEKLLRERRVPKGKIECLRGGIIFKKDCIPGCNEACQGCTSRQEGNVKAGGETLTKEEETMMRYEGVRGSGYGAMIEPYAEI
jgi:hypothetical protein